VDLAPHRTYQILQPLATHWRAASCADVACDPYLYGWRTTVDTTTDLGRAQADHIRHRAGRAYTEDTGADGLTYFTFEAGQTCFQAADHRVPLDRPQIMQVVTGYGNQLDGALQMRPADWVEDFAEHIDSITAAREAG
jgi:hypothetical protein